MILNGVHCPATDMYRILEQVQKKQKSVDNWVVIPDLSTSLSIDTNCFSHSF
jgi:hypothetical protein